MKALTRRGAGIGVVAAALALFGTSACGTTTFIVQSYKGPPREPDTLAILRVNGWSNVQLLQVDAEATDVPIASDSRLHIELLPGQHEIVLLNRSDNPPFEDPVSFVAEAGRAYRPGFATVGEPGALPEARMYEVDRETDQIRRDVSRRASRGRVVRQPRRFAPATILAPGQGAPLISQ